MTVPSHGDSDGHEAHGFDRIDHGLSGHGIAPTRFARARIKGIAQIPAGAHVRGELFGGYVPHDAWRGLRRQAMATQHCDQHEGQE